MYRYVEKLAPNPTPPGKMRCAECGHSVELTYWAEWDLRHGLVVSCPNCGGKKTTLLIKAPSESDAVRLRPDDASPDPYVPSFPDIRKEDLPEAHQDKRRCRKCNDEFVLTPGHRGYINICPACNPTSPLFNPDDR